MYCRGSVDILPSRTQHDDSYLATHSSHGSEVDHQSVPHGDTVPAEVARRGSRFHTGWDPYPHLVF